MRDAYDVLDDLSRAGVYLIVVGDRLQWRCDPLRDPVPGALFLELKDHKAVIVTILLTIPAGCPVPHICRKLGICQREVRSSACTLASQRGQGSEGEDAA